MLIELHEEDEDMATDALKTMKEQLMSCVQGQLGDLSKVDTHELG
jgi:hypothetical protein